MNQYFKIRKKQNCVNNDNDSMIIDEISNLTEGVQKKCFNNYSYMYNFAKELVNNKNILAQKQKEISAKEQKISLEYKKLLDERKKFQEEMAKKETKFNEINNEQEELGQKLKEQQSLDKIFEKFKKKQEKLDLKKRLSKEEQLELMNELTDRASYQDIYGKKFSDESDEDTYEDLPSRPSRKK